MKKFSTGIVTKGYIKKAITIYRIDLQEGHIRGLGVSFTYFKWGEKMRKIIEYEDIECQKCCISCKEDRKTCEYRKQRRRAIDRMTYRAKKEYEKRKQGE